VPGMSPARGRGPRARVLRVALQFPRQRLRAGFPIPSPAVLGRIGRGYVEQINAVIAENEIPTVRFVKGDVKEEIAREHFQRAEREDRFGVVMVGVAQEKTSAWRGWRDGGPDGHPHFEYRRQSIFPNNYCFYIRDPDWGPSFLQTVAYAPFPVWDLFERRTSGPSSKPPGTESRSGNWTTGSPRARTPKRSPRSARVCLQAMSARSSIAGRPLCPRR
jgi:hypothetical protein